MHRPHFFAGIAVLLSAAAAAQSVSQNVNIKDNNSAETTPAYVWQGVAALRNETKLLAFENWYRDRNPDAFRGLRLRRWSSDDSYSSINNNNGNEHSDSEGVTLSGSFETRVGTGQPRPGVVWAGEDGLAAGGVVSTVSAEHMISLHTVEESVVGQLLTKINQRWGFGLMYDPVFYETLAIYMLYEKFFNPQTSEWQPFIDLLPEPWEMDNVLFWSSAELQLLEGSPLRKRALERRTEVRDNFHWLQQNVFRSYPELFGEDGPTEQQYRWAVSAVRSTNLQAIQYGELIPAICPLFAMFRSTGTLDATEDAVWDFPEETEVLTIRTRDAVASGGEILIPFGKPNSELVDFYGFAREDNFDDAVHVDVDLRHTDPLANEKQIMFKQANIDNGDLKITARGITFELETSLRIATVVQAELTSDMVLHGMPEYSLGERSDYAIAMSVVSLCRQHFQLLPSSDREDRALLARTVENRPEGRHETETDEGFERPEADAKIEPHAYNWPLTHRQRAAVILRVGERNTVRRVGAAYFRQVQKLSKPKDDDDDDEGAESHDEL